MIGITKQFPMKMHKCLFIINKGIPVSYTHLDVYKRQVCDTDISDGQEEQYSEKRVGI